MGSELGQTRGATMNKLCQTITANSFMTYLSFPADIFSFSSEFGPLGRSIHGCFPQSNYTRICDKFYKNENKMKI
jgi:hypothetical protein